MSKDLSELDMEAIFDEAIDEILEEIRPGSVVAELVHMHVQLTQDLLGDFFTKCKRSRGSKDATEQDEEDDASTQVMGESPVRPAQPVQPVGVDDVSESGSVKSFQPSPYQNDYVERSNVKPGSHESDSDGGIKSATPWPHEEGECSESETSESDSEVECDDVSVAVSWPTFIISFEFHRNPSGS